MLLLSFTAENHASLRDAATLDLIRPSLRTLRPPEGRSWQESVYPVAAVFGPNASGKSTVMDAFLYARTAIRWSATRWQDKRNMPRAPFLLDPDHERANSRYEFDFVHDDVRYVYGFEVGPDGIEAEWLRDLPRSRWRSLFERTSAGSTSSAQARLTSLGTTTRRELLLSRALLLGHAQLAPIGRALINGISIAPLGDVYREHRLRSITNSLATGDLDFDDITTLLQVADIGVRRVEIEEQALSPEALEITKAIQRILNRSAEGAPGNGATIPQPSDEDSDEVIRSLQFTHRGDGAESHRLTIEQESSGTVAWLSLAVPAMNVLRQGGVLCVDEIDASLHSHLVETLIGFFTNPDLNRNGSQLIFTSHDTFLLSPLSDAQLDPEQVWFTEKGPDGATVLYSLADFPRHQDANVAKRYLSGRYGAIPRTAPSVFARLLENAPREQTGA